MRKRRTDRPIQFSDPMVLALLQGRKTQTRRLFWTNRKRKEYGVETGKRLQSVWTRVKKGDLLWVRESHARSGGYLQYCADHKTSQHIWLPHWKSDWHPPMHMLRNHSRITLRVTGIKVERVSEISYSDIVAEGVKGEFSPDTAAIVGPAMYDAWEEKAWLAWQSLWIKLHGQASWEDDPRVVAIAFEVHHRNIDHA